MDTVKVSDMAQNARCPTCGAEIAPGATHCTRCLIELAITQASDAGGEPQGPGSASDVVRFGGYEIASDSPPLEGGMGIVYRAWQVALRRHVALKMIKGGLLVRPEQIVRFRTEAE